MSAQFQTAFLGYRDRIEYALAKFFDDVPRLLDIDLSDESKDALAKLCEFSMRPGKRLRGSLAAAAYDQASGRKYGEAGIQLAVALELIQNYLLIIDDVMDESELRRGQPTLHRLFEDSKFGLREAEMLAVNVGLISQHLANIGLLQAKEASERIAAASQCLHANVAATGFGQIEDMSQRIGGNVSNKDIIRKYYLKTSYYTFINPLQAGLALAGKSSKDIQKQIRAFGEPAGIAFQLHDDYLGIFGASNETGKSNLDDIKEGKYTMLVQRTLEVGSEKDVIELRKTLGNKHAGEAELKQVRDIFNNSGATMYVRAEARRFADIAKQKASAATVWNTEFRAQLVSIVDYIVSRNL